MDKNQKNLLRIFYIIILGVIVFAGYNIYLYFNRFTLDRKQYNMSINAQYKIVIYGYKGKIQNNSNFKYKIDDDTVATVDDDGVIIPKKVGKANIVVTSKHGGNVRKSIINRKTPLTHT